MYEPAWLVRGRSARAVDFALLTIVTLAALFVCYEFEVFPTDTKPYTLELDELLLVTTIFSGGLFMCALRAHTEYRVSRFSTAILWRPIEHAGSIIPISGTLDLVSLPFRLVTSPKRGKREVSFKIAAPNAKGGGQVRAVVDLEVCRGAISIGCVGGKLSRYKGVEERVSAGPRRKAFIATGAPDAARRLVIRNADSYCASIAHIYGIEISEVDVVEEKLKVVESSLWDAHLFSPDNFDKTGGDAPSGRQALANISSAFEAGLRRITFPIVVTHTSRPCEYHRCTREFLRERYRRPGRLDKLPPFEELPHAREARSYSGRVSFFELTIAPKGIDLKSTRFLDSEHKSSHLCRVGDEFIINLDDYLLIIPAELQPAKPDSRRRVERVDDPWFAGLQTVFAIDDNHCVVSASPADALMVLDVKERRVVRRWRVPFERYGRNYDLTETSSVHEHFIANDLQLTHLNCAYPDGNGGFWISTLAQGDIGHVSADGTYEVIVSGFVGCHGVRYSRQLGLLYFSDSCSGRLMGIGADRVPRILGSVDSSWLHDAQHLAGNLFILCLCDKNALVVLDVGSNTEAARFDMKARGENVKFINLVGEPVCEFEGRGEGI